MRLAKVLLYINIVGAIVIVGSTLSYDLWQKSKITKYIADAQRTNLFIRDFRALSSEVSAVKDLFFRLEFRGDSTIVLYDASKVSPPIFSKQLVREVFSDRNNKNKLCELIFFYDPAEPLGTGMLIWIAATAFLTPVLRRLLIKQEIRTAAEREDEIHRKFSFVAKQVAHDIRSPLSALRIAAGSLPPNASEQSEILKLAALRISKIADDLLNKETSARLELKPLKQIAAEVIAEKNIELSVRPEIALKTNFSHSTFSVLANPLDLSRVISNLINNACESITGPGQIEVSIIEFADGAELTVADSGAGIPAEVIGDLGVRRVSHGKTGSGLGLLHAAEIAQSVGGQLRISSKIGSGTRVSIRVPRLRT